MCSADVRGSDRCRSRNPIHPPASVKQAVLDGVVDAGSDDAAKAKIRTKFMAVRRKKSA